MLGAPGWRKNRNGVCGWGQGGGGGCCLLGTVSVLVLETDGGDHCTTMRILNTTE